MARRVTDDTPLGESPNSKVNAPTVNPDGLPDRCLSFTIESDWGHFRRIDRTVTKQTYRLPPRTTIAGMLAAITGVHRDGYYDTFADSVSAVGIELLREPRTVTEPSLGLGTNPNETMDSAGGTGQKTVKVRFPDSTDNRQIHSYELLVNPAYRIDVAVEDPEFYGALKQHLERGTSYYPPSMGLSEFLAWVEYHGEFDVETAESNDSVTIQSAVPDGIEETVPKAGTSYSIERVPGFMEATGSGRRTTGYVDLAFAPDPSEGVEVVPQTVTPARVDGRTVVFS